MAAVFVSRVSAILLVIVAALAIICVVLGVLLHNSKSDVSIVPAEQSSAPLSSSKAPLASAAKLTEPWEKEYRIPESTIPYHYDLTLLPNLNTAWFTGHIDITIGVTKSMSYLVTHTKFLNISNTELKDSSGRKIKLKKSFEYEPNEFWVVLPEKKLNPDNFTLSLDFDGYLKRGIVGFYMSEYTTKLGEKR